MTFIGPRTHTASDATIVIAIKAFWISSHRSHRSV